MPAGLTETVCDWTDETKDEKKNKTKKPQSDDEEETQLALDGVNLFKLLLQIGQSYVSSPMRIRSQHHSDDAPCQDFQLLLH